MRPHPALVISSHFSGFDSDLESFESILDFVNLGELVQYLSVANRKP